TPSQKSPGFSPRDEYPREISAREGALTFRPGGSTILNKERRWLFGLALGLGIAGQIIPATPVVTYAILGLVHAAYNIIARRYGLALGMSRKRKYGQKDNRPVSGQHNKQIQSARVRPNLPLFGITGVPQAAIDNMRQWLGGIIDRIYQGVYVESGLARVDPVTGMLRINAGSLVEQGAFGFTPPEVIDDIVTFAGVGEGTRVFDFGSGDGWPDYKLASYGAHVDGMELNRDIFGRGETARGLMNAAVCSGFFGWIAAPATAITFMARIFTILLRRVRLSQGDMFESGINFSQYDVVYTYYPEPKDNNEFLRRLDACLSDLRTGLRGDASFIVLRQETERRAHPDPFTFEHLECVRTKPLNIRHATHLRHCTLYEYRLRQSHDVRQGPRIEESGPAIAFVKQGGQLKPYELSAKQHDIVNRAWAQVWDICEMRFTLKGSHAIACDIAARLKKAGVELPIHIHSPPQKLLYDAIYALAGKENVAFPDADTFRLVTHPGTGREGAKSRSCNFLVTKRDVVLLEKIRKNDKKAYDEWLDHEIAHVLDRLNKEKGREKPESAVAAAHPTAAFEASYARYLNTEHPLADFNYFAQKMYEAHRARNQGYDRTFSQYLTEEKTDELFPGAPEILTGAFGLDYQNVYRAAAKYHGGMPNIRKWLNYPLNRLYHEDSLYIRENLARALYRDLYGSDPTDEQFAAFDTSDPKYRTVDGKQTPYVIRAKDISQSVKIAAQSFGSKQGLGGLEWICREWGFVTRTKYGEKSLARRENFMPELFKAVMGHDPTEEELRWFTDPEQEKHIDLPKDADVPQHLKYPLIRFGGMVAVAAGLNIIHTKPDKARLNDWSGLFRKLDAEWRRNGYAGMWHRISYGRTRKQRLADYVQSEFKSGFEGLKCKFLTEPGNHVTAIAVQLRDAGEYDELAGLYADCVNAFAKAGKKMPGSLAKEINAVYDQPDVARNVVCAAVARSTYGIATPRSVAAVTPYTAGDVRACLARVDIDAENARRIGMRQPAMIPLSRNMDPGRVIRAVDVLVGLNGNATESGLRKALGLPAKARVRDIFGVRDKNSFLALLGHNLRLRGIIPADVTLTLKSDDDIEKEAREEHDFKETLARLEYEKDGGLVSAGQVARALGWSEEYARGVNGRVDYGAWNKQRAKDKLFAVEPLTDQKYVDFQDRILTELEKRAGVAPVNELYACIGPGVHRDTFSQFLTAMNWARINALRKEKGKFSLEYNPVRVFEGRPVVSFSDYKKLRDKTVMRKFAAGIFENAWYGYRRVSGDGGLPA
ncbi:MAG: hypothetical protein ABH885_00115, partial [Candidatus Omnitrophota bacterium]